MKMVMGRCKAGWGWVRVFRCKDLRVFRCTDNPRFYTFGSIISTGLLTMFLARVA